MQLLKLNSSQWLHTHRLIQLTLQSRHHHTWSISSSKNTQMHIQVQRKSAPTICEGNLQWGWVSLNGMLLPEWPGRNKSRHTVSKSPLVWKLLICSARNQGSITTLLLSAAQRGASHCAARERSWVRLKQRREIRVRAIRNAKILLNYASW